MSAMQHDDLGLQPERTGLAWSRTLVSFAIVLGLLGAHAYHDRRLTLVLVVTMVLCALLVILSSPIARWRTRHTSRHLLQGTSPVSIPLLLALTAVVVASSLAALVMIAWTL